MRPDEKLLRVRDVEDDIDMMVSSKIVDRTPRMASNNSTDTASKQSIGAILIDAGKIGAADAERVLRLQLETGIRFGDAAKQLGLISDEDIAHALSHQFDYPYLTRGSSQVSLEVAAAYSPFSAPIEALRALRSQLLIRWFNSDSTRRTLAIVSPSRREGRSWLSANLGVVFSQLGTKTLIIDADLRNPRQHTLFGLENRSGLSSALAGRDSDVKIHRIPSLIDLSVMSAGALPPNPQELLARPVFDEILRRCADQFDVILVDTPSGGGFADALTISAKATGALMVARRNSTQIRMLRSYSDMLIQSSVSVVGTVLNERSL